MKLKFISAVVVLFLTGFGSIHAQKETTPKKESVIHIKMIKNINGVETIVDTTINAEEFHMDHGLTLPNFNIDKNIDSLMKTIHIEMSGLEGQLKDLDDHLKHMEGLKELKGMQLEIMMDTGFARIHEGLIQLEGLKDLQGLEKLEQLHFNIDIDSNFMHGHHGLIMKELGNGHFSNMGDTNVTIMILNENDAEYQKYMEELEKEDVNIRREKRVMIIEEDCKGKKNDGEKMILEMQVIVKTCNIEDLDKEDRKRLKNEEKSFNEKLKIDQVNFYPNPNNGRFNLGFTLEKQGDTEISIFDMNGKNVYSEKLSDFTGSYKKEIDISDHASGIYYIKVTQGKDSFFKKMIME